MPQATSTTDSAKTGKSRKQSVQKSSRQNKKNKSNQPKVPRDNDSVVPVDDAPQFPKSLRLQCPVPSSTRKSFLSSQIPIKYKKHEETPRSFPHLSYEGHVRTMSQYTRDRIQNIYVGQTHAQHPYFDDHYFRALRLKHGVPDYIPDSSSVATEEENNTKISQKSADSESDTLSTTSKSTSQIRCAPRKYSFQLKSTPIPTDDDDYRLRHYQKDIDILLNIKGKIKHLTETFKGCLGRPAISTIFFPRRVLHFTPTSSDAHTIFIEHLEQLEQASPDGSNNTHNSGDAIVKHKIPLFGGVNDLMFRSHRWPPILELENLPKSSWKVKKPDQPTKEFTILGALENSYFNLLHIEDIDACIADHFTIIQKQLSRQQHADDNSRSPNTNANRKHLRHGKKKLARGFLSREEMHELRLVRQASLDSLFTNLGIFKSAIRKSKQTKQPTFDILPSPGLVPDIQVGYYYFDEKDLRQVAFDQLWKSSPLSIKESEQLFAKSAESSNLGSTWFRTEDAGFIRCIIKPKGKRLLARSLYYFGNLRICSIISILSRNLLIFVTADQRHQKRQLKYHAQREKARQDQAVFTIGLHSSNPDPLSLQFEPLPPDDPTFGTQELLKSLFKRMTILHLYELCRFYIWLLSSHTIISLGGILRTTFGSRFLQYLLIATIHKISSAIPHFFKAKANPLQTPLGSLWTTLLKHLVSRLESISFVNFFSDETLAYVLKSSSGDVSGDGSLVDSVPSLHHISSEAKAHDDRTWDFLAALHAALTQIITLQNVQNVNRTQTKKTKTNNSDPTVESGSGEQETQEKQEESEFFKFRSNLQHSMHAILALSPSNPKIDRFIAAGDSNPFDLDNKLFNIDDVQESSQSDEKPFENPLVTPFDPSMAEAFDHYAGTSFSNTPSDSLFPTEMEMFFPPDENINTSQFASSNENTYENSTDPSTLLFGSPSPSPKNNAPAEHVGSRNAYDTHFSGQSLGYPGYQPHNPNQMHQHMYHPPQHMQYSSPVRGYPPQNQPPMSPYHSTPNSHAYHMMTYHAPPQHYTPPNKMHSQYAPVSHLPQGVSWGNSTSHQPNASSASPGSGSGYQGHNQPSQPSPMTMLFPNSQSQGHVQGNPGSSSYANHTNPEQSTTNVHVSSQMNITAPVDNSVVHQDPVHQFLGYGQKNVPKPSNIQKIQVSVNDLFGAPAPSSVPTQTEPSTLSTNVHTHTISVDSIFGNTPTNAPPKTPKSVAPSHSKTEESYGTPPQSPFASHPSSPFDSYMEPMQSFPKFASPQVNRPSPSFSKHEKSSSPYRRGSSGKGNKKHQSLSKKNPNQTPHPKSGKKPTKY